MYDIFTINLPTFGYIWLIFMLNVVQYIPYMDPMGNEMVDQNAACWDVKRSRLKTPDGLIPLPVPVQLFMRLYRELC